MDYLIVEGMFYSTGVKDGNNNIYLYPDDDLNLPDDLVKKIVFWLYCYGKEKRKQYSDSNKVFLLDKEGIDIAHSIKKFLKDTKIEYFSDATMEKTLID